MEHDPSQNPLQSYFDWQVTTLMLAYDLMQPIDRDDEDAVEKRRAQVEQEVRELSLAQVPHKYLDDETLDWPPQVMQAITRATLARAQAITNSSDAQA